MWLHLSFDSIIIISWTNGITKIPRVTTTSNIKPFHSLLCLSFFVADLLTLLNKMVLFMTLAFFCFSFASFFFYQKMKGNLYWIKKKLNVRQSDARNFKFTLYKMWQMHDLHQNEIRPDISICEPRNIDLVISL